MWLSPPKNLNTITTMTDSASLYKISFRGILTSVGVGIISGILFLILSTFLIDFLSTLFVIRNSGTGAGAWIVCFLITPFVSFAVIGITNNIIFCVKTSALISKNPNSGEHMINYILLSTLVVSIYVWLLISTVFFGTFSTNAGTYVIYSIPPFSFATIFQPIPYTWVRSIKPKFVITAFILVEILLLVSFTFLMLDSL